MNKIEALKAAQDSQFSGAKNGTNFGIWTKKNAWELRNEFGSLVESFPFEDQKSLAKDTLCLCSDNVLRYSEGRMDPNGRNSFFPAGCSSKNLPPMYTVCWFKDFEVIETPTDFEKMQTPDEICIQHRCHKYSNKYQRIESEKWLNGECERCRISVSKPSGMKNV